MGFYPSGKLWRVLDHVDSQDLQGDVTLQLIMYIAELNQNKKSYVHYQKVNFIILDNSSCLCEKMIYWGQMDDFGVIIPKNVLHLFNAEDVVLTVCIWMLAGWAAVYWDVHITWRWIIVTPLILVRNVTCMLLCKSIYSVCISFLMIVSVVGWLYQSRRVFDHC